ncbi:GntR family transcriptional regulator [candidate division KSB3 bacterium]|uniref:GntR family transcriptional regulator n=1 Tax=candidate division KSB3 bacterium TaxID=2044937 RepID=A0A9D5JVQ4_9BACT|nr:GntR family transcriptional regulator [candidate division KSB3 bacterium]MBD3324581.1 GntR family transcriptional regulator [candidate division KSB3 bacterium]
MREHHVGQNLTGQAISLRGLADQVGVSFMPVREALWQLESEKMVVKSPHCSQRGR